MTLEQRARAKHFRQTCDSISNLALTSARFRKRKAKLFKHVAKIRCKTQEAKMQNKRQQPCITSLPRNAAAFAMPCEKAQATDADPDSDLDVNAPELSQLADAPVVRKDDFARKTSQKRKSMHLNSLNIGLVLKWQMFNRTSRVSNC